VASVARAPESHKLLAYSIEQAAAALGVHPNNVKKYVRPGELAICPVRELGEAAESGSHRLPAPACLTTMLHSGSLLPRNDGRELIRWLAAVFYHFGEPSER
jgi:hypothetical protein